MGSSAFKSVDLSKALVKKREVRDQLVKEGIRLKSADVLRAPANLAIVNLEVNGTHEGLRFDVGKRVFLDSLGSESLDAAVQSATEPIRIKIMTNGPVKGSYFGSGYTIAATQRAAGKSKSRAGKAGTKTKSKAKTRTKV